MPKKGVSVLGVYSVQWPRNQLSGPHLTRPLVLAQESSNLANIIRPEDWTSPDSAGISSAVLTLQ